MHDVRRLESGKITEHLHQHLSWRHRDGEDTEDELTLIFTHACEISTANLTLTGFSFFELAFKNVFLLLYTFKKHTCWNCNIKVRFEFSYINWD